MQPFARFASRFWLGGLALALLGVGLARLLAPTVAEEKKRSIALAAGQIVAISGLGLIAYGIHRRSKDEGKS